MWQIDCQTNLLQLDLGKSLKNIATGRMNQRQYISIIIPAYNRATIIPATLDSILAQSFQDWECIVVDDKSKDDTPAVVQKYVDKDCRFSLLSNERKKGAQGARNTGILHAKYDWVICFDSDNTMHPDMLEKLVGRISDEVDVVQCFSRVVDANTGKEIGIQNWMSEGEIHQKLFLVQGATWETYVDFNQSIVRKRKLLRIGLLDENCPSMQEWDTHIRLSRIARYTTLQEPLLDYSLNGADAITSDKRREVAGRMYILRKYLPEWKEDTKALHNFLVQICMYIHGCKGLGFRIKKTWELICLTPRAFCAVAVFWKDKIIRYIQKRL